jgi:hypothetical protein
MEISVLDYVALAVLVVGVVYFLWNKYGSKLTVTPSAPVVTTPVVPTVSDYLDDLIELYNSPNASAETKTALEGVKNQLISLEKK